MGEIRQLNEPHEFREAFPVMRQLRTHLTEDLFAELVGEMQEEGYTLFALVDEGEIRAAAGIAVLTNLYYGKHVWVYDLVTDNKARSKGFGYEMLAFLESFAAQNGCSCVALSSNFERVDAHRFYEDKAGYDRVSYVFKKNL
ncbi:GNAT family N-acetyltransferase [Fictibacillus iocasae]|uniref:GNAT family N-acetyltransferase n=1 Tax=Fictibacillus iocasae TaxID=2715437 RepID=A0ABW2NXA8_9BACL